MGGRGEERKGKRKKRKRGVYEGWGGGGGGGCILSVVPGQKAQRKSVVNKFDGLCGRLKSIW